MMGKVFVFLADGFEEIEGLTVVDMLRRAEIPTVTVSIGSSRSGGSNVCTSRRNARNASSKRS